MSKQLPAELKKKIIDKANNYEWEDNPEAVRSAYIDGATDYAELLAEAQGRITTLEAALNNIVYPIKYLQDKANLEGAQIDGIYAIGLSVDAEFLKGIAKEALTPIKQTNHETELRN